MVSDRRPWLGRLAIIGGAARGLVYVIAGGAAINAAFHARRSSNDMATAFKIIVEAPMGRVLLAVTAAGLAAFAVWCLLDAILDTSGKGTKAKAIAQRAAGVLVGCVYIGLSFLAIRSTLELSTPGGTSIQRWTAVLLSKPFGQCLAGIAGLIIIAVGAHHLGTAFRGDVKLPEQWSLRALGRYGLASRGLLFLVIGGFMTVAAIYRAPDEARGLPGAFRFLGHQPFGSALVCVVGLGLAVHGVISAVVVFRSSRRLVKMRS